MNKLKEYLINRFPDARLASGGSEVVMRCRFCGDSQKDKNARHLYIKVTGDTPFYHCFKCETRGVLNPDTIKRFLVDYNDDDIDICNDLVKISRETASKPKLQRSTNKYNIRYDLIKNDENTFNKLNYISNRLGVQLSIEDFIKCKIVPNIFDLFVANNISSFTRSKEDLNLLNECSIGFLSMDNSHLIMRNIKPDMHSSNIVKSNRYNIYSLFPKSYPGTSMYTIPTTCYYDYTEPIKIHVAEGPFDILSVFYNLRNRAIINNCYIAVNGKNYGSAIEVYASNYGIINAEYHFYVDSDVSNTELCNIRSLLHIINCKGYIHRNIKPGEKDFGVDLRHISESIIKI